MTESQIQSGCVLWFRYQHQPSSKFLISVPNGGYRGKKTGGLMKKEGAMAGAPDLILFCPRGHQLPMFLEAKTETGRLRPEQKQFRDQVVSAGYRYEVFRSLEQFSILVDAYLGPEKTPPE